MAKAGLHIRNWRLLLLMAILNFCNLLSYSQPPLPQAHGITTPNAAAALGSVKIVTSSTLATTSDLQYGKMTIPHGVSGGDVIVELSTSGIRSIVGSGAITFLTQMPYPQNAAYLVSGSANTTYVITLPAIDIQIFNGSNSAYVTNFKSRPASTGVEGLNGTLDGSGHDTFVVGAELHLSDNQPSGAYTGTFDVTVNFN